MTWSRQLYAIFGLDPEEFTPLVAEGSTSASSRRTGPRSTTSSPERRKSGGDFGVDCRVLPRRRRRGAGSACSAGRRWPTVVPVRLGRNRPGHLGGQGRRAQAAGRRGPQHAHAGDGLGGEQRATLAEALDVIRAQLLGHDDWMRAVAFADHHAAPRGRRELTPAHGRRRPEFEPNDYEWAVARMVLANAGAAAVRGGDPAGQPLDGLRLPASTRPPAIVVVLTNTGPFARHAMLRSMVEPGDRPARPGRRARACRRSSSPRPATPPWRPRRSSPSSWPR